MCVCKSSFCLRWVASLSCSGEVWLIRSQVEGCVKHRGAAAASQTVSMCLSKAVLQQCNQHSNTLTLIFLFNYRPLAVIVSSCTVVLGVCVCCVLHIFLLCCIEFVRVNWVLKGQWQKQPCVLLHGLRCDLECCCNYRSDVNCQQIMGIVVALSDTYTHIVTHTLQQRRTHTNRYF